MQEICRRKNLYKIVRYACKFLVQDDMHKFLIQVCWAFVVGICYVDVWWRCVSFCDSDMCRIVMWITSAGRHHRTTCHWGQTRPPGLGQTPLADRETSLFQSVVNSAHCVRHSLRHAGGTVLPTTAWLHWQPDRLRILCSPRTAEHRRLRQLSV